MSPTHHSQEQGAVPLRLLEVQLEQWESAHGFSETVIPFYLHLQRRCSFDVVYDIGERRWIESLFVSGPSYLSRNGAQFERQRLVRIEGELNGNLSWSPHPQAALPTQLF